MGSDTSAAEKFDTAAAVVLAAAAAVGVLVAAVTMSLDHGVNPVVAAILAAPVATALSSFVGGATLAVAPAEAAAELQRHYRRRS